MTRWRTKRTTERVSIRGATRCSMARRRSVVASSDGRAMCWAKQACRRSNWAHDAATRPVRVVLLGSRQRGLTARRAEARGTVTGMGRDRASGLGSAKSTRARSRRDAPSPNEPASMAWSAEGFRPGARRGRTGVLSCAGRRRWLRATGDRSGCWWQNTPCVPGLDTSQWRRIAAGPEDRPPRRPHDRAASRRCRRA